MNEQMNESPKALLRNTFFEITSKKTRAFSYPLFSLFFFFYFISILE